VPTLLTQTAPFPILPHCPVCPGGEMEGSPAIFGLHIFVCLDCGSTLNVPMAPARLRPDPRSGHGVAESRAQSSR
jgi:hypothetical protein